MGGVLQGPCKKPSLVSYLRSQCQRGKDWRSLGLSTGLRQVGHLVSKKKWKAPEKWHLRFTSGLHTYGNTCPSTPHTRVYTSMNVYAMGSSQAFMWIDRTSPELTRLPSCAGTEGVQLYLRIQHESLSLPSNTVAGYGTRAAPLNLWGFLTWTLSGSLNVNVSVLSAILSSPILSAPFSLRRLWPLMTPQTSDILFHDCSYFLLSLKLSIVSSGHPKLACFCPLMSAREHFFWLSSVTIYLFRIRFSIFFFNLGGGVCSDDNFQKTVLSLHHVGSGNWAQNVSLEASTFTCWIFLLGQVSVQDQENPLLVGFWKANSTPQHDLVT